MQQTWMVIFPYENVNSSCFHWHLVTFVLCKLAAMSEKRASLKNERIMGCGLSCLMEVKPLWLSSRALLISAHTFRGISQGFPTVQTSASLRLCAEMHKRRRTCPSVVYTVMLSSLLLLYLGRGLIFFDMLYNLHILLVHSCLLSSLMRMYTW